MHKSTPVGPQNSMASHLSNIPYIVRHCDLLKLNRIHEKKLQIKNKSFTDCHEGLIMKANWLSLFIICHKKSTQIVLLLKNLFCSYDTIINKGGNSLLLNLASSVFCGSETRCIQSVMCLLYFLSVTVSFFFCWCVLER